MSGQTPDEGAYIFGTDADEFRRLAQQHELWVEVCRAHWKRAGFGRGQTLLDLGAGPGFAALELATWVGTEGRIIAAEPEPDNVAGLRAQLAGSRSTPRAEVEVCTDRGEDLDLDPGSLDGAYARWMFTFVSDLDPVLARVRDALRPGGTLAILDYFHWPSVAWGPRSETLPRLRAAVLATYADYGTDGSVGQKLPAALVRAGFELTELRPLVRIARPADPLWQWPEAWLRAFLPTVVAHDHLTETELRAWRAEWDANALDEAGWFASPTQVEIIARKPH